jgi:hypothetical protein
MSPTMDRLLSLRTMVDRCIFWQAMLDYKDDPDDST